MKGESPCPCVQGDPDRHVRVGATSSGWAHPLAAALTTRPGVLALPGPLQDQPPRAVRPDSGSSTPRAGLGRPWPAPRGIVAAGHRLPESDVVASPIRSSIEPRSSTSMDGERARARSSRPVPHRQRLRHHRRTSGPPVSPGLLGAQGASVAPRSPGESPPGQGTVRRRISSATRHRSCRYILLFAILAACALSPSRPSSSSPP